MSPNVSPEFHAQKDPYEFGEEHHQERQELEAFNKTVLNRIIWYVRNKGHLSFGRHGVVMSVISNDLMTPQCSCDENVCYSEHHQRGNVLNNE